MFYLPLQELVVIFNAFLKVYNSCTNVLQEIFLIVKIEYYEPVQLMMMQVKFHSCQLSKSVLFCAICYYLLVEVLVLLLFFFPKK